VSGARPPPRRAACCAAGRALTLRGARTTTGKTYLRRIEKFYRAQGFYQAKVTGAEVKPHGRKEVDVLATVEEGDPTRIRSVDLQGLDDLPEEDRNQLLDEVKLKVGQIFMVERWDGLDPAAIGAPRS
jgi:outer membrane protein assembly factor BamA